MNDKAEAAQPAGTDLQQLKALAEQVKGWSNVKHVWRDSGDEAYVVGHINEDGEKYPVVVVDTQQYYEDSPALANFYAAASPAVVLDLIARIERAAAPAEPLWIQLGQGKIEIGQGHHGPNGERLPAILFGRNGAGAVGVETEGDRHMEPGECLAAITFENPESLDVVAEKLAELRARIWPAASPATASGDDLPQKGWLDAPSHYSESESRAWARGWESARAAVSAATKPTADLSESEQYRQQMAVISVAAHGYWKEGDGIHPDYDTVPLRDVAKLYAKYEALAATKPAAQTVPEGWKITRRPGVPEEYIVEVEGAATAYVSPHNSDPAEMLLAMLASDLLAPAASADAVVEAKNAARYRWLRNESQFDHRKVPTVFMVDYPDRGEWEHVLNGDALDKAIDEAMSGVLRTGEGADK